MAILNPRCMWVSSSSVTELILQGACELIKGLGYILAATTDSLLPVILLTHIPKVRRKDEIHKLGWIF
jgi:hypothetical protein